MKDYSTLDNYKEFILSYKIVDNKIVVELASGDNYIIPNTKENENKIIHKMETQIMNIKFVSIHIFIMILILKVLYALLHRFL